MTRWKANTPERLQAAALQLFHEQGYAHTTVVQIAAQAGLTERTFFRYFTHKREALFFGAEQLEALAMDAVDTAPASLTAMQVVMSTVRALTEAMSSREGFEDSARLRHQVIQRHQELRERELAKLAALAATMRKSLQARGLPLLEASMAAEAGIVVFKVAFESWAEHEERLGLAHHVEEALQQLRASVGQPR